MKRTMLFGALVLAALVFIGVPRADAHCDSVDGPVVKAARLALQKGDAAPVLGWVKKENEGEMREAFRLAYSMRSQAPEARRLAETWFFETAVRLHRAGEGAPYTGLKPAGTPLPHWIAAADQAVHEGAVGKLSEALAKNIVQGLEERFARVVEKQKMAERSVEGRREFVEAYVAFMHYVEGLGSKADAPSAAAEKHEH